MTKILESGDAGDLPGGAQFVDLTLAAPEAGTVADRTLPTIQLAGNLAANLDVDYYRISLRAGDIVTFDIDNTVPNGAFTFDMTLGLFDAGLVQVAFNDDNSVIDPGSTSTRDPFLAFTATGSGDVLVRLQSLGAATNGSYTLFVTVQSPAVILAAGAAPSVLEGWLGNDRLTGGIGNDTLSGLAGRDLLRGGAGGDSLLGGAGRDTLLGETGNDLLDGGTEDDRLSGGAGSDTLFGGVGNDTLDGGTGDDTLVAGVGGDLVVGGTGNDVLFDDDNGVDLGDVFRGGAGNDTIFAGSGDVIFGDDGNDTISVINTSLLSDFPMIVDGGAGIDRLLLGINSSPVGARVEMTHAADGSGFFRLLNSVQNWLIVTFRDVEAFTYSGQQNSNAFGATGNDILRGGSGNDSFDGGAGRDSLFGGDGSDTLVGGGDTLSGPDTLEGGAGNDTLVLTRGGHAAGGEGNDRLTAGTGIGALSGGEGSDTLTGTEDSQLYGDGGDDLLVLVPGVTIADGGEGTDRAQVNLLAASLGAQLELFDDGSGFLSLDFAWTDLDGIETLDVTGSSFADTLLAGVGDDILRGGIGNDSLAGGDGNDSLDGGTGNDTLLGGAGADTLFGGSNRDVLTGGAGQDRFRYTAVSQGGDTITDFNLTDDAFQIAAAGFGGGLVAGVLPAARLISNLTGLAEAAFGQFVLETDAKRLWWDADGTGGGAKVLITGFTGALPALTAADFIIL